MEGTIVFIGFLLLALICGPWIGLALLRSRIRRVDQRLEDRFSNLTQRIFSLETTLKTIQGSITPAAKSAPPQAEVPAPRPELPIVAPPPPKETTPPVLVASPPKVELPKPVTPTPIPIRPVAPPTFASAEIGPTISARIEKEGGLEELLGKNWLNKLGIVLLVIGIAFFLAYQLKTLGPAGKVFVGYAVSFALLGAGIWFERSDRYRVLARAGIGGGWALLFFTTYAMYHVPAAHVLSSQGVDLVLMLIVALAMVWHTLRYNSQVVTGLAFLLAFSTVLISRVNVYSLSAGVVLAIGIVLITLKRNWFQLEIFGILATYLNHYFWLRPIIEPMGANKHPFAEFLPSAAILVCYWLIYRVSYVVRTIENDDQEHISTAAALLDSILLLGILKYQAVHPEWAFWALLAFGAVELLLGQLRITKRRRIAFVVLSTIGAVLLVAAIPFRYSGAHVSAIWLLEAEALFLIGVWTNEILFSRLGLLAGFATAGQMLAYEAVRVFARRIDSADLSPDYRVGLLVLGVAAVIFYVNAHYISRRWSAFERYIDQRLLVYSSYTAAVLAVASLWMAFPEIWTAVAWSAFALVLAILSRRFAINDLAVQANVIAAAALLRVIVVNFSSAEKFHHVSLRLVTIATVAVLYYFTSHWTGFKERASLHRLPDAYTWTASTLLAVLVWYELAPISVALAWCLFGVLLFEIGAFKRLPGLRWQAYVALVSSFLRIFFVNLNAEPTPGEFSARVYTILPIAVAFFYIYTRRNDVEPGQNERVLLDAQSWLGSITVAALVRFELPPDWVVTGWAALTVVLIAIAYLLKNKTFTQQALLLALGVFFRATLHNFYVRGATQWSTPSLHVAYASALLFASLFFAFRLRQKELPESQRNVTHFWNVLVARPEQFVFFVPLLMTTVLLALEMRSGLITVSWGIEAVVVFLFALWVGVRSFRYAGLALLLLAVGKIVVVDVWGLDPRDRYITFIIMGIAVLSVSFLYTRFSETIKKFL